jgi:site-specific DNA-methyltransferase (adenine-specific)
MERIGNAMLILGDAREELPFLPAGAVDFIFTDPPYGHNNNNNDLIHRIEKAIPSRRRKGDAGSGEYKPRPIANDGPEANELVRWFFGEADRLLAGGGCCCCCCCGGGGPDPQFARWALWLDEALGFKQMVVWDKGPIGLGWHYRRSYETVLVGQKRGGACRWYDETKIVENVIRPGNYGIRKIIPSAADHPTPKPSALAAHFIGLHSRPGDLVLDPFMGGASTGVAAIQSGRGFIGIEIEPEFFDLALRRIRAAHSAQKSLTKAVEGPSRVPPMLGSPREQRPL